MFGKIKTTILLNSTRDWKWLKFNQKHWISNTFTYVKNTTKIFHSSKFQTLNLRQNLSLNISEIHVVKHNTQQSSLKLLKDIKSHLHMWTYLRSLNINKSLFEVSNIQSIQILKKSLSKSIRFKVEACF